MKLGETESIDIPQGHDDLTVKNLDPEAEGIYSIKGGRAQGNRKIAAGETQRLHTHHSSVKIINLGSPMIEVLIRVRKMRIAEEDSFDIPEGLDNFTITCLDPNIAGSYTVKGDSIDIDTEIPSGETHTVQTKKSPVKVTNTGYPMMEVILPLDAEEA